MQERRVVFSIERRSGAPQPMHDPDLGDVKPWLAQSHAARSQVEAVSVEFVRSGVKVVCGTVPETQEPRGRKPPRGSYLSVLLRPKACTVEDDLRNYTWTIVLSHPKRNSELARCSTLAPR